MAAPEYLLSDEAALVLRFEWADGTANVKAFLKFASLRKIPRRRAGKHLLWIRADLDRAVAPVPYKDTPAEVGGKVAEQPPAPTPPTPFFGRKTFGRRPTNLPLTLPLSTQHAENKAVA